MVSSYRTPAAAKQPATRYAVLPATNRRSDRRAPPARASEEWGYGRRGCTPVSGRRAGALGDRFVEGNALFLLARAHRGAGRLDEARAAVDAALQIANMADNQMRQGHWLVELARIELAAADPGAALTSCQRAAVLQRRLGDRSREATAIDLAGQAYQQLDRPDEAAKFHRRAASVHRDLDDRWQLAGALDHLAAALDRIGEQGKARQCRREAVSVLAGFDDPPAVAMRERLRRTLTGR